MHKIKNLWNLWLNWSSKLLENNEAKREKKHPRARALSDAEKRLRPEVFKYLSEELPLSKINNVTSEGAVSHNVLHYQQLSIARYQVRFIYANEYNYFSVQCNINAFRCFYSMPLDKYL